VFDEPEGVVIIAGGKQTTYRRMAREAVDAAGRLLAGTNGHGRLPPCTTARRPLPGAQGLARPDGMAIEGIAQELARVAGVAPRVAEHLSQTYGSRATAVVRRGLADPALLERIDPELPYVWAEVPHAVEAELARTLEDVLVRRIPLCLRSRDQGLGVAARVAAVVGGALGWVPAEVERQLDRYRAYLERTRQFRRPG
jgi:glycerol-3-phosphate dehydrogenase